MSEQERHYRKQLAGLVERREAAGGALPIEEESAAVAELNESWWRLAPAEQARIERDIRGENEP